MFLLKKKSKLALNKNLQYQN